jgi:hypothetical protein
VVIQRLVGQQPWIKGMNLAAHFAVCLCVNVNPTKFNTDIHNILARIMAKDCRVHKSPLVHGISAFIGTLVEFVANMTTAA